MTIKPFVPPFIYQDNLYYYLEWPTYALKFAKTEDPLKGLARAIPNIAVTSGYVTGNTNIGSKLIENKKIKLARKTVEKRRATTFTESQRASASAAIRKMRMKP